MNTKKVKAKHPFQHHGRNVQAGDVLEVDEHEANNLITAGHADEHDEDDDTPKQQGPGSGSSNKPGGSGGGAGPSGGGGSGPANPPLKR